MLVSVLIVSVLSVVSNGQITNICAPDINETIPHPTNFGKFLECVNGIGHEVSCPEGLIFNAKNGFCYEQRELTTAVNSITSKGYNNCPGGNGCGESPPCPSYPNCPQQPQCPGYPGYPGYGYPVGTCPICNDMCEVHMLPDEKDCTVFYMCDWGCPIWKRCPAGLHFNTYLRVCDYPWRAGCANDKPQCQ